MISLKNILLIIASIGIISVGSLQATITDNKVGTMSYDFTDRPLSDVLHEISIESGINIILKEDIGKTISLRINNLPWKQVLDLITIQYGLEIQKQSDRLWFVSTPPSITIQLKNADIRTVIEIISRKIGWNFVIDPDVKGTITLDLRDVPWRKALDVILQVGDFRWVENENKIVLITTSTKMLKQMVTKVVKLKYLKPKGEEIEAKMISQAETFASLSAPDASSESSSGFAIFGILNNIKSPTGNISFDAVNNALIITDSPTVINKMLDIINTLDTRPAQIVIDTKMVDVSVNDINSFGANWSNGIAIGGGFDKITDVKFPIRFGNGLKDIWDHFAKTPMTLDASQTNFVFQFLDSVGSTKVTQSPRITTLDNQRASIFIGETIRFAEQTTTISESGVPTTTFAEASSSPLDIGTMLMVIPRVIKETNDVMMTVVPYESAMGPQGMLDFGNGALQLPQTKTNVAVTKMIIKSGNTGIIGGRTTDEVIEKSSGIPGLNKIPVLKWFFKNEDKQKNQRKLLIFITPTVITGEEGSTFNKEINKLKEEAVNEQRIELPNTKMLPDEPAAAADFIPTLQNGTKINSAPSSKTPSKKYYRYKP